LRCEIFIEFLKRLMIGSRNKIFLIVDRGPTHVAKKTMAFVAVSTTGIGDASELDPRDIGDGAAILLMIRKGQSLTKCR
jgi:hypothetical protein